MPVYYDNVLRMSRSDKTLKRYPFGAVLPPSRRLLPQIRMSGVSSSATGTSLFHLSPLAISPPRCLHVQSSHRRPRIHRHLPRPALPAQPAAGAAAGGDRARGRRDAGHGRHHRRRDRRRAERRADRASGDRAGRAQGQPPRPADRRGAQTRRRDDGRYHGLGRAPRRHPGFRDRRHRRSAPHRIANCELRIANCRYRISLH